MPIPADFPEGPCEAVFCDASNSIRRKLRNDPAVLEPRDLDGVIQTIRMQTELEAHSRICTRSFTRAWSVGAGSIAAEPAGKRAGSLCVEA